MIPHILIPREIEDAARDVAKDAINRALDGVFGLIQAATLRRQSYAFAHEQAVFHAEMTKRLKATTLRIVGLKRKIRRHARLAMKWDAKAKSRDPRLAQACGLYECRDGLA